MHKANLNEIQDKVMDILGSAMGTELIDNECYVQELTSLFADLSDTDMKTLWEMLRADIKDMGGWWPSDEDLIKKLLVA